MDDYRESPYEYDDLDLDRMQEELYDQYGEYYYDDRDDGYDPWEEFDDDEYDYGDSRWPEVN